MKLFRINSIGTALRAITGWLLLITGLYMAAALAGSIIPANNNWRQPDDGITVFVETNDVHVSLILPMAAAGEDFGDLIRPDHLLNSQLYGTHAMIGWGHGGVYRNAPTWADVRSGDIVSAVFGSDDTTLHIYHVIDPKPAPHRRAFRVTPRQYRMIVKQVKATFKLDKDRNSVAHTAYADDNLFYDSYGHYNALNTCNTWTGDILKRADVRIGIWTPLPGGIMRWFSFSTSAAMPLDR